MVNNYKDFILVVDDEKGVLAALELGLEDIARKYNLSIKTFSDPVNGLEFFNLNEGKTYCRLIISDVNMPRMNGVELVENVRKLNPQTKVIFMTADPKQDILQKIKYNPTIISKPFNLFNIMDKVEEKLEDKVQE